MKSLNVFYESNLVGTLSIDADERLSFKYDVSWLNNPQAFPLSLALKLSPEPYGHLLTKSFFENLIPEGNVKEILESHSVKNIKNEFNFLNQYGEDCSGAFVITEKKEVSKKITSKLKKEMELEVFYQYLRQKKSLTDALLNIEGGRFSLAGAQDKFAVIIENNRIFLPLGNIPTTHIIKPQVRYFDSTEDSPYNEYFCMTLARQVGLSVPDVDLIEGDYPLYIVRRFDRIEVEGIIKRIHQQDFCQARGITSLKKYESEGGPTFASHFQLIKESSSFPIPDLNQLLTWFWFNLSIGNNDCHSKNLAFLQTQDGLRLSPFYDLLSTAIYKDISPQFSYKIGGQVLWYKLQYKHFQKMAHEIGINVIVLLKSAKKLFEDLDQKLNSTVLDFESRFPNIQTAQIIKKEINKRIRYFREKIINKAT